MTDFTPRVPPHSNEAEISLLGSVLLDNDALTNAVVGQVVPVDFYRESHRKIWACIPTLREKRGSDGSPGPVELATLAEELIRRGQLDEVGGLTYLIGLSDQTSTAVYAEHFARIVLEKAHLRQVISHAGKTMQAAYEQQMPLEDIDALAASAPRMEFGEAEIVRGGSLLAGVLEQASSGTGRRGAPTGLTDLDDAVGGFEGTRLYVLGARPGMGKTAAAFQMAVNVAATTGRVLGFSLEMPAEEIMTRLLCSEGRVDLSRFTDAQRGKAQLSERDWGRLIPAQEFLNRLPLDIVRKQNLYLHQLTDMVRREHQRDPLSMFVLDYLQLVKVAGRGGGNRTQEVGEISRELKNLALELQIPVLALSQLNRGVEDRPNKRPQLSDLRESGSVEQDADVVMFIYRDEVYNKETDQQGVAEFGIGKQRNGPTGMVKVQYHAPFTRFSNLARFV
ncbi:hypothetical protein DEIPH_ctg013orf0014 [Deinococcus phoenicis]|uniref:Replicative DNA helicase n=1 Tax=Deinococcus phoenicis TaxID=1476583 RepID=A0A016QSM5_9DEIO|nr:replicative DNA helicase [Deinococcus phoenicis]EYB68912.1 hypothetical protein DEIPH_ctg013orf0014 [Deinococcus phoenicis]